VEELQIRSSNEDLVVIVVAAMFSTEDLVLFLQPGQHERINY